MKTKVNELYSLYTNKKTYTSSDIKAIAKAKKQSEETIVLRIIRKAVKEAAAHGAR